MKLKWTADGSEFEVEVFPGQGDLIGARIDGRELRVKLERLPGRGAIFHIEGVRSAVRATRRDRSILVAVGPAQFEFMPVERRSARAASELAASEVTAPMPGKILKVLVGEGERIESGQALLVMEAMKMETTLSAESAAVVKRVRVAAGQMVDHGDLLIELGPAPHSSPSGSEPRDL